MRERLIELLDDFGDDIALCDACKRSKDDCVACKNELLAEHLLKNGVVVLPCKVGDVVYYTSKSPISLSVIPNKIYKADVVRIVHTNNGVTVCIQIHNEYGCTEIPYVKLGKDIFLTKEEAEAALEKLKSKE